MVSIGIPPSIIRPSPRVARRTRSTEHVLGTNIRDSSYYYRSLRASALIGLSAHRLCRYSVGTRAAPVQAHATLLLADRHPSEAIVCVVVSVQVERPLFGRSRTIPYRRKPTPDRK